MSRWQSIYIPQAESAAVRDAFAGALQADGWTLYDPFPGGDGPGAVWSARVSLLVAPPLVGWVRVLGEAPESVLAAAVERLPMPMICARLDAEGCGVAVWSGGKRDDSFEALFPWLRDGVTADDLRRAWGGGAESPAAESPLPLPDDVPDAVKGWADQVNAGQAAGLFERLAGGLIDKLDGGESAAGARALLRGVDWSGAAGRRLSAVLDCVLPPGWRDPSPAAVAGAYQVARARRVNPQGLRLPGDDEALALVPNALEYTPLYAGRR